MKRLASIHTGHLAGSATFVSGTTTAAVSKCGARRDFDNTNKRTRLIQAARTLAYRHGFREASLADIARQAQVPLGNVYYYFKTKEEIGEAIVEERLADMKSLQRKLEELDHPEDRFESVRS